MEVWSHDIHVILCLCDLQDLWGEVEISWNYLEFEVRYESLADEIKIGGYRVWFPPPPPRVFLFSAHLVA